ncbi:MAG TPA: hypothetical protein VFM05_09345 [Candidatus Saccharimonadales bacterium]|nr:hypothetical protein [Candidatus Saccharimonadales bacterium]
MKTRSRITKLIVIMAVAAIAVIGSSLVAGRAGAAGRQDVNDIYVSRSIIGVIPGQGIRVSVGNTAVSPGSTVTWTYKVTNPGNVPLYESEWRYVPVRRFSFSDVSREDLNTEGEPGTRRAEVMVTVTLRVPAGSNPEDFPGSLEIIKEDTGATVGTSMAKLHLIRHTGASR